MKINRDPKNIWADAFGSLFGVALMAGLSLVALGVLIFAYPQLIGFLIATLVLMAGGLVLFGAWKVWKFKREVKAVQDDWVFPPHVDEIKRSPYTFRRVTWIVR